MISPMRIVNKAKVVSVGPSQGATFNGLGLHCIQCMHYSQVWQQTAVPHCNGVPLNQGRGTAQRCSCAASYILLQPQAHPEDGTSSPGGSAVEGGLLFCRHHVIPVMHCISSVLVIALVLINVHGLHLLHVILACPPLPALAPPVDQRSFPRFGRNLPNLGTQRSLASLSSFPMGR